MQTFPRGDVQRNPSIFSHKATNIYVFFLPRWGKQPRKKKDECRLVRMYSECSLDHPRRHPHHFAPPCKENRGLPQNCSNSPLSNIRQILNRPFVVVALFHSFVRTRTRVSIFPIVSLKLNWTEYHSVRFSNVKSSFKFNFM